MQQEQKIKLNCLEFILKNEIQKEGFTEFQLAEQLFKWSSGDSESVDFTEGETFPILPEGVPGVDLNSAEVKTVLRKINQNPERMKKLGGVLGSTRGVIFHGGDPNLKSKFETFVMDGTIESQEND